MWIRFWVFYPLSPHVNSFTIDFISKVDILHYLVLLLVLLLCTYSSLVWKNIEISPCPIHSLAYVWFIFRWTGGAPSAAMCSNKSKVGFSSFFSVILTICIILPEQLTLEISLSLFLYEGGNRVGKKMKIWNSTMKLFEFLLFYYFLYLYIL